ncbi:hypothetical protein HDE_04989 [Halotydeus destructor]|nr:hypothetical protein HDE_04989 [Halotydeus destructor]
MDSAIEGILFYALSYTLVSLVVAIVIMTCQTMDPVASIKVHVTKWLLLFTWSLHTYLVWSGTFNQVYDKYQATESTVPLTNYETTPVPESYTVTAMTNVTLIFTITFLILTIAGCIGVCCETIPLLTTVSFLWSSSFIFDIGSHVAANIDLLPYQTFMRLMILLGLWYFLRLLKTRKRSEESEY